MPTLDSRGSSLSPCCWPTVSTPDSREGRSLLRPRSTGRGPERSWRPAPRLPIGDFAAEFSPLRGPDLAPVGTGNRSQHLPGESFNIVQRAAGRHTSLLEEGGIQQKRAAI